MKILKHLISIAILFIQIPSRSQVQSYILMNSQGGKYGFGTIITGKTDGTSNGVLYNFDGDKTGSYPLGNLVSGKDGFFYGVCNKGGSKDNGTIFKITSSGNFTLLHDFNNSYYAIKPSGSLTQALDGNFYGMCSAGGVNDDGAIVRISSTGGISLMKSFTYTLTGGNPAGNLTLNTDGFLYGMCPFGGGTPPDNSGTISLTDEFLKLI